MPPVTDTFERTLASARTTVAFRETLRLAYDSFLASKVRFLLTMLGMVIGSASVILVATLGLTGRQYALNMIASIGPNMVEMQYNGGTVAGPNNVATPDLMTREDMTAVLDQVPGITASSPMLEIHDRVSLGNGLAQDAMLLGVSSQYKEVRNLKTISGRFFDDQDEATHAKVAVIVKSLAEKMYGSSSAAIGHTITFSGIPFTIIGVFKESIETFGMSEVSDSTILIPYAVARYFTGTDTLKQIFFSVPNASDVEPAANKILSVIKKRHRPTSVYVAFTLTQVLTVMGSIATMLTIVLTLASAITLVVSGVGIMNSMLANVQSRIREIGIRKALGATSNEIRLQFLTESIFMSLAGGVVGTVIGLALPLSVGLLTDYTIPQSPWPAVIALCTSILVGVIFGTLPAERAARLDPVTTLKYE
ncbi:ABC transporter permease [Granulicella cerasi]|uniref:ABC transporter permease n=1 Tax=Granulicella cerasi TaxID=741063 RepID=A0ABW1ZAR0_9BACT|nr:ABC transporter permease [Granulicella cerasi]